MKKLGFVTPWYGENIPGGAEMELRGLVEHLHAAGIALEILTTCVKDFNSRWDENYHTQGEDTVNDITVRRFNVQKRNVLPFESVNIKLMNKTSVTRAEEEIFVREMVNSPALYKYMEEHSDDYSLYIMIPYMFGTTYYGCQVCPEKTVFIPCFHDEQYLYMSVFKEAFAKIKGIIYHAQPEYDLANRVYDLRNVTQSVLGEGVYTEISYNRERGVEKLGFNAPFILYAGRKDVGKNVYTLINYFAEFKRRMKTDLKLILIGGGEVALPEEAAADIYDLGFVEMQDKYDIFAAAAMLCQPSKNESFSLVIMESWLCGRPVLVNSGCEVTTYFSKDSNGGLYFQNYFEFEGCVNYLLKHPDVANVMGENGRQYVLENFAWGVIVEKYVAFFKSLCGNEQLERR